MVTSRLLSVDGSGNEDKYFLSDDQKKGIEESKGLLVLIELLQSFLIHKPNLLKCFQLDGPRGIFKFYLNFFG